MKAEVGETVQNFEKNSSQVIIEQIVVKRNEEDTKSIQLLKAEDYIIHPCLASFEAENLKQLKKREIKHINLP